MKRLRDESRKGEFGKIFHMSDLDVRHLSEIKRKNKGKEADMSGLRERGTIERCSDSCEDLVWNYITQVD